MATETSWDPARWRDSLHQGHPNHDNRHTSQPAQLSAPTAVNPAFQSAILGHYAPDVQGHDAKSHASAEHMMFRPPPLTGSSTDVPPYHGRPQERHSPSSGGNHGPQQLAKTSPHHTPAGPWQDTHHQDHRASTNHASDAPLTLHIPRSQDLPRLSPAYENQHSRTLQTPTQPHNSLPSFTSFSEHAATRSDDPDVDGPEIAPMASRLSCYLCTKLQPMVRDVAIAVAELDEHVQAYCNKSVTRTLDIPKDDPLAAVQWILDRLRFAKRDVQDATGRAQLSYPYQTPMTGMPSQLASPSIPLKRQAAWDRDDFIAPKRPRSGDSPHESAYSSTYSGDRGVAIDVAPRTAWSPPPPGSAPLSAYPRQTSPGPPGSRPLRALPSPSSLAYPPSAAPSLPPPTVHSVGSPAPSYQHSTSIHTASTSSATSAHIADLQHQVTLKSLSLQTLQSEYSTLLQKLQRERVKGQAIEKKTSVADNEVNELTGKNEELTEQVKALEIQVEESERKREAERAEAAREKEQWGRMLDMSGRLQAKSAEGRQKLVEERDQLLKRVTAYEEENKNRFGRWKGTMIARTETPQVATGPLESNSESSPTGFEGSNSGDVASLRQEVSALKASIEVLRVALYEAKQHNQDLSSKVAGVLQHSSSIDQAIDRALNNEGSAGPGDPESMEGPSVASPSVNALQAHNEDVSSGLVPRVEATLPSSANAQNVPEPQAVCPTTAVTTPHSTLFSAASLGRAVSPGPAELGFHVQPSTSSPEELIKALGPLPAPYAPFQSTSAHFTERGAHVARSFNGTATEARSASKTSPPSETTDDWVMPSIRQQNIGDNSMGFRPHVSSYTPMTSPYANQGSNSHRIERSSHSYHSSPGPARDAGDSPTNSADSSSSETNATVIKDERISTTSAYRPLERPAGPQMHIGTFRQWDQQPQRAAMPPPPRPFTQPQVATQGSFAGIERSRD